MSEYHLYCLDLGNRNVETKIVEATSDDAAVLRAQALTGLRHCEVWRNNRLVAKITEFLA